MLSIYIHFPFCRKKCVYCDFVSGWKLDKDLLDKYIKYLIKEISLFIEKYEINEEVISLYFGGGTPSLIEPKYLYNIVNLLCDKFKINLDKIEFSIEANPEDVNCEVAYEWKNIGINRVSLGFQSMNQNTLNFLGRNNTPQININSYFILKELNFMNINIDLIISIPNDNLKNSLENVLELKPQHISTYNLSIEEKTLLYVKMKNKSFTPLNDNEYLHNYWYCNKLLKLNNYIHYEISNYAINDNYKSIHNLNYWNYGKFLGFGLGATGFIYKNENDFNGYRWNNYKILKDYFENLENNILPIEDFEIINYKEAIKEYILLNLRKVDGLNLFDFFKFFKQDFNNIFDLKGILKFNDYIEYNENYIKLKKSGINVLNQIIIEFWNSMII